MSASRNVCKSGVGSATADVSTTIPSKVPPLKQVLQSGFQSAAHGTTHAAVGQLNGVFFLVNDEPMIETDGTELVNNDVDLFALLFNE